MVDFDFGVDRGFARAAIAVREIMPALWTGLVPAIELEGMREEMW